MLTLTTTRRCACMQRGGSISIFKKMVNFLHQPFQGVPALFLNRRAVLGACRTAGAGFEPVRCVYRYSDSWGPPTGEKLSHSSGTCVQRAARLLLPSIHPRSWQPVSTARGTSIIGRHRTGIIRCISKCISNISLHKMLLCVHQAFAVQFSPTRPSSF